MKRNLGFMMRLGSMFARFWLLFSENDSTDGTKEFLAEYGRRYPQVQGDLLQGESNLYSVRLCPKSRRNCPARVKLLSRMRQLVYERALRLLDAMDAFIMVDIDFLSVDIRSFLQMFYAGRRLSAAAIAGQSMYRNSREDWGAGTFPILFGYISYRIRILMYLACILKDTRILMYLDVSQTYLTCSVTFQENTCILTFCMYFTRILNESKIHLGYT